MADRTVTVRISAQDSFSSVIQRYNQQMGTAEQATRRVNNTNRETGDSFDALGRRVTGAIAAIGVMKVVQFGADMAQLGQEVRVTEANFQSLTNNIGGSEAVLRQLRSATHGSLNDLELMNAANNFLALGLANTADEMAQMSQQAIQLGGAVGTGPVEAIETLQRALRNQSFEMLDSLGVSAANVRARINELKQSGMEMSDAFRQATLEQLSEGVDRLGASADAAFTPTDALLSRLENFRLQAASNISAGIDGIALAVLNADRIISSVNEEAWYQILGGISPTLGLAGVAADQSVAAQDAAAARNALRSRGEANAAPWLAMQGPTMADFATLQGARQTASNNASADSYFGSLENMMAGAMQSQRSHEGGYFWHHEADEMRDMANQAETLVAGLERIAEIQPIDETKLANAQSMADFLGDAADEAERSAEAFEHMSLSELMGQGSGGRYGELGDMVLEGMDLPEEEMSALRDTLDLASGRQTELSQTVRDELVPLLQRIGEEEGAQALADAVMTVGEAMDERRQGGDSPRDINTWLEGILGGGSGGLGRSSGRGEDTTAIDSESFMAALEGGAGSMTTMADQTNIFSKSISEAEPGVLGIRDAMPDITEGFSGLAGKAEVVAGFITTTHDLISQLVGSVQVVRIDIRPTAPSWLIALASGAGQAGGAFVAQIAANNGGQLPGVVDR